ncbi:B-cell CLL/lymphoma 9-like protein isoform X1 [Alligator mississippiensis]|uniref:B-cell CLL/lymphoma 9-like protein isoform X1 n=1 Tax=Alligator mississippiensis TaxID=8496 RepID=UPI0003D08BA2|nr:B-cell CLL/lymphoma 9-like protein isoform X1 [Alligator mississippiensis]XP_059575461.1 B-cell CLL/lymphoma 9-like protein isoform X1 [Alligator mississippiensis]XP_059575462.1 B-cell CLL/lymphoma 9-like protein isoform X1 [Alligator mississippiensis]XP_059575463.1 B-cell CLL/lymphoma 9-like protein isoform X1 [Alligator mississippiensis]
MHPDNKLTNHGKTGNSGAQSQHHNVSQGPTCNLGSKGVGAGNHGGKASQISPGNSGLKNSQNAVPNFGSLKGKGKRERSISVDSGEQREASTPSLDTEPKGEVAPRSKRRCVLERKQPYSGDEWCSGPDSEEDDKPVSSAHNCNVADPAMSTAPQLGPGSNPLPSLNETGSSSTPHGATPGLRPDGTGSGSGSTGKQPSQFVYVFTTNLANTAAEAVLQGRADSILAYHQQNVPRAKLDQAPAPKVLAGAEQLPINPPAANTPQSQPPAPQGSQSQPQPPPAQPPPPPQGITPTALPTPVALPQEGAGDDVRRDLTPNSVGNSSSSNQSGSNHPNTPTATATAMQPGLGDSSNTSTSTLLGDGPGPGPGPGSGPGPGPGTAGNGQAGLGPRNPLNSEGLSKEQLEHRERSLQTLRDIERMFLRSGEAEPFLKSNQSASEGSAAPQPQPPPAQPPPPPTAMKKYEEPLQSMISQTQSLGGPSLEHEVPHHPGSDMGQQMNMMMQRLNQDNLTPEQVAWRKLQEEYYEEKRRKEEQISIHGRPMQEMMIPQSMSGMIMRGPPPPYHSKPGEQWPPGMGSQLRGPIDVQDPMPLRGGPFPGPRFPGSQMQRVPGFGAMQNMPMDALGPMNAMQRPVRPGMGWSDDMPPIGGPGNFPQGNLPYPSGQGDPERFMTPRAREEILRHQLMEKRPVAVQRPMGMSGSSMSQGMEMERMIQAHRQMDPSMFPGQMPGESLGGAPLGMDFAGTRGMLSPPMSQSSLRDMDTPLGPGNLNMNMNVNMNMNMNLNVQMTPQQQMLMSQKMRGPDMMGHQGMSPEEVTRARAQNGSSSVMMGTPQKMMIPSQFASQGQQGFPGGQGPYHSLPQEMGSSSDMFTPEQGTLPVGTIGSTTRLSHIPLPPASNPPPSQGASIHPAPSRGLGRRPSDLTISIGQMNSPGMGHLKSPTLSQVHSPLGTSPSANLKSPQTPSQMVSVPPANPAGPLKSPQVMSSSLSVRSPTSSPSRLKSPSMAVPSPAWVPSPKTTLSSPGVSQSKQPISMNSASSLGGMEQGSLPPGPRSSSSAPASNPSSTLNPNMPFTSSPDPSPSQNPLSLMMSQMSKYAMPSSTPLYHNAIKTIATSDDELLPDRPMLPPGSMAGVAGNQPNQLHLNSVGPASSQSPMGMSLPGQQPLSHEPPTSMMSSPNPLGSNIPMHPGAQGAGIPSQNPMMLPPGHQDPLNQQCGPVPNSSQMIPSSQLVFPRMQQPHGAMPSPAAGMPMAPGGGGGPGLQQHYPPGMALPPEDLPSQQPGQMPPQQHLMGKSIPPRIGEPYPAVLPGVASVLNDPELSEVIRPTPTGIPEFDLSRIIPSEKPSSTLQYFPKGDTQVPKSQPSNLHLMNLQNMMTEQTTVRPGMAAPSLPGQQSVQRGLGMPMCHPGQVPVLGRTGMPPQQGMMGSSMHQGMMSPQQSLMAQQNFMLMQAKQRSMSVSGEMYAQAGHMMSPQGSLMGPPPQQNLMVTHQMRQRSVSLDSQMNYLPGPGNMANLPF